MATLVDDEEDGTTAEELEEAVGTKVAFVCGWISVTPLINSIILSQKYSLVIELVKIVVKLCYIVNLWQRQDYHPMGSKQLSMIVPLCHGLTITHTHIIVLISVIWRNIS